MHTPILDNFTSSAGGSSLFSSVFPGGLESIFSIHAAIGFLLVLIALLLAVAVNVAALVLGSGLRLTTAGSDWVAPPPGFGPRPEPGPTGPAATHSPPDGAPDASPEPPAPTA